LIFDASREDDVALFVEGGDKSAQELFGPTGASTVIFATGIDQKKIASLDPGKAGPFARAFAAAVETDWPELDLIMAKVRSSVRQGTKGAQVPDWYRVPGAVPNP